MDDERRYQLLLVVVDSTIAEDLIELTDNYYFIHTDLSFDEASGWMEEIGDHAD